jgi:uncharacterized peroxidase-related enzyme
MEFVRAVVRNWRSAPLSEPEKALLEYAEKLTLTPNQMTPTDLDRLRAAGWSDEDIHDATQVIAYFNYINRVADALGVQVDEWVEEFERELYAQEKTAAL